MRRPDGTYNPPAAQARELQADMTGWCVWWGAQTRAFWAVTQPPIAPLIVEAMTADDLVARISWARNAGAP